VPGAVGDRVVVDTNVLVSGLLRADGPPGQIVDLMVAGHLVVLYDDRIMAEYDEVLWRPRFDFEVTAVETILNQIRGAGERVVGVPLGIVLPDEDDLPFLEAASAGGADALITGNAAHYRPSTGRHQVSIMAPRAFLTGWRGA
jgi:putative PIN family toxin of toxin-antitoxin system